MQYKLIILTVLYLLFIPVKLFSQTDIYTGTWEMEFRQTDSLPPIHIGLKIANPEKNILYPAQLQIKAGATISPEDLKLCLFTDSVDEAVKYIQDNAINKFGLKAARRRPSSWWAFNKQY